MTKCDLIQFIISCDKEYPVNILWAKKKNVLYKLAIRLGLEEKNV